MKCWDKDGNLDPTYAKYRPWTAVAAAVFSLGVPCLYHYLVQHFIDRGLCGDVVVEKALGWSPSILQKTRFCIECSGFQTATAWVLIVAQCCRFYDSVSPFSPRKRVVASLRNHPHLDPNITARIYFSGMLHQIADGAVSCTGLLGTVFVGAALYVHDLPSSCCACLLFALHDC